ncbi:MAG: flagellar hook assembly protein FlgD [Deltaproteobacteria bacterium]|nr:flagellar hook assembly protein FlgD [Deltaproteobacteria bacterium]
MITNVIGTYEQEQALDQKKTGDRSELGKEAFLQLLVTQLRHQDPLNPMDDKEFTAQLAQFSSLEQLTQIAKGIDGLQENSSRQEMLGAVSFIGKTVTAEGNQVSKVDGKAGPIYYSFDDVAAKMYINVYDADGNIIYSANAMSKQPGSYEFTWDGSNYMGGSAPDGVYYVYIAAEGVNGQPVLVNSEVAGVVAGVENVGGQIYLRLQDGRYLDFMQVTQVVDSGQQAQESEV